MYRLPVCHKKGEGKALLYKLHFFIFSTPVSYIKCTKHDLHNVFYALGSYFYIAELFLIYHTD